MFLYQQVNVVEGSNCCCLSLVQITQTFCVRNSELLNVTETSMKCSKYRKGILQERHHEKRVEGKVNKGKQTHDVCIQDIMTVRRSSVKRRALTSTDVRQLDRTWLSDRNRI